MNNLFTFYITREEAKLLSYLLRKPVKLIKVLLIISIIGISIWTLGYITFRGISYVKNLQYENEYLQKELSVSKSNRSGMLQDLVKEQEQVRILEAKIARLQNEKVTINKELTKVNKKLALQINVAKTSKIRPVKDASISQTIVGNINNVVTFSKEKYRNNTIKMYKREEVKEKKWLASGDKKKIKKAKINKALRKMPMNRAAFILKDRIKNWFSD